MLRKVLFHYNFLDVVLKFISMKTYMSEDK
jgi:hypothetical protein